MSLNWIRRNYGVPAKRGMQVEVYCRYSGRIENVGRITSGRGHIRVNGQNHHPTDGVVYLDADGSVLMDTRKLPSSVTWHPISEFSHDQWPEDASLIVTDGLAIWTAIHEDGEFINDMDISDVLTVTHYAFVTPPEMRK